MTLTCVWTMSLDLPKIAQSAGTEMKRDSVCSRRLCVSAALVLNFRVCSCRLTELNSREYLEEFEEKWGRPSHVVDDGGDVVLA
jgi:hypothetical protein